MLRVLVSHLMFACVRVKHIIRQGSLTLTTLCSIGQVCASPVSHWCDADRICGPADFLNVDLNAKTLHHIPRAPEWDAQHDRFALGRAALASIEAVRHSTQYMYVHTGSHLLAFCFAIREKKRSMRCGCTQKSAAGCRAFRSLLILPPPYVPLSPIQLLTHLSITLQEFSGFAAEYLSEIRYVSFAFRGLVNFDLTLRSDEYAKKDVLLFAVSSQFAQPRDRPQLVSRCSSLLLPSLSSCIHFFSTCVTDWLVTPFRYTRCINMRSCLRRSPPPRCSRQRTCLIFALTYAPLLWSPLFFIPSS